MALLNDLISVVGRKLGDSASKADDFRNSLETRAAGSRNVVRQEDGPSFITGGDRFVAPPGKKVVVDNPLEEAREFYSDVGDELHFLPDSDGIWVGTPDDTLEVASSRYPAMIQQDVTATPETTFIVDNSKPAYAAREVGEDIEAYGGRFSKARIGERLNYEPEVSEVDVDLPTRAGASAEQIAVGTVATGAGVAALEPEPPSFDANPSVADGS